MTKRAQLISELSRLIEVSCLLRDVLVRNEQAMANLVDRVGQGDEVLEAFDALDGAMRRHRELPETLEEFELARHHTRLALFGLALSEGASASELGRRLGISRQLASRLAGDARTRKP